MKRLAFLFLFLAVLVVPNFVSAVDLGGLDTTATKAGVKNNLDSPDAIAGQIIGQIISLVGIIFFCLALYAGALWMSAAGDEKKIELAKQIILAAVIGLIIVASAYAITNFVGQSIQGPVTAPST
ncbi:MAG: hypothetical protein NTY12_04870 [Candidatus Falkowbacteria bacterium]|nr:hypothetical protein [Candidatus Falkowbacteria bacterium]